MLLFLLQAPQCRGADFSSLDLIVYGASPAPLDLLRNALRFSAARWASSTA